MRTPSRATADPELPAADELRRLKLSPEVAWYLLQRGYRLPDCPPATKTPEPRTVRGSKFDPGRVDKVLAAFAQLQHTKGQWAGRSLVPEAWEVAYILAPVFGWVRKDPDAGAWVRIIRSAYVDLPRKNGKSTIIGGIGIYLTCADGEEGAEVVAAATSTKQARYVFDPVRQLAQKSPKLRPHVKALSSRIVHRASNSYMEVVSSVADAMHGGNIHGGLVDELHVHASPDLVDAIETGTGSRTQPLLVMITTADEGKVGTIYARKRDYVEKLAKRVFKDPTAYGVIWCAEKTDDPFVEATWKKANPNYGISVTRAYMRSAATKAQNSPADLAQFQQLHLGLRVRQAERYLTIPAWDASAGIVDETKLAGRACHGGLDLSSVEDVTALSWTFEDDDGGCDTIWRFWLPEAKRDAIRRRTAGESEVWIRSGVLRLTEGNVIDHDFIVAQVLADADKFDVQTLGYDRWSANEIVRRLGDEGLTCVPVGQGYQSMSQPLKEILRLVLAKKYRHGGNPMMRWMVDNLAVRMDPAGNVKPDKDKSGEKIDGVSAACTAMREVLDTEPEQETEVWGFYS